MEITVTISKGKIESDYIGVTEQAGIYAGDGGFAVNVGDRRRQTVRRGYDQHREPVHGEGG